jgi:hypothetical protein
LPDFEASPIIESNLWRLSEGGTGQIPTVFQETCRIGTPHRYLIA